MADLENILYSAVDREDVDEVKYLLIEGANLNVLVNSGRSILGRAVQNNNVEIVDVLLDCENYYLEGMKKKNLSTLNLSYSEISDADNEMSFSALWSPLGPFSSRRKCNMNLADAYQRSPLHYAAEQGNNEILTMLLNAGCRKDVSDNENVTPLHLAACRGHYLCVQMLLKAGCKVNYKTRYASDKASALHMTASINNCTIAKELIKYGAKVDILDASERTPLFVAVCRQNYDVVQVLLDNGAKVNISEIHGYTPLVEAVLLRDVRMVRMLTRAGSRVLNNQSFYLVHHSVHHQLIQITKYLLDAGAVVNVRDDHGDTPLHIACGTGSVNMVELLIDYGTCVALSNNTTGCKPVHEAVNKISEETDYSSFHSILQLLLRNGCSLNVETAIPGETPLHASIVQKKFRFARTLIRYGCDVNVGCVYMSNFDNLHLAVRLNCFQTVQMIVSSGFNLRNTKEWLDLLPPIQISTKNPNTIKDWLKLCRRNPRNLKDLCRITVRKMTGQMIMTRVNSLKIPTSLKNFLTFRSSNHDNS